VTPHWLVRASLRLLPASWRGAVQSDLEDEARAQRHGALWSSWQLVRLALPLRWAVTGHAMLSDLRYAGRSLGATPLFALTAIVTFALGIGVNIAVFSAVDRMLFRPLPYADVDRLMFLRDCSATTGACAGMFPSPVAYALAQQSATIEAVGVVGFAERFYLSREVDADAPLSMIGISPSLLKVLGVQPVIGRDAGTDEVAARRRLAWMSHETWTARLGGTPDVLGRRLFAGKGEAEVVGVLPRGFIPPAWTQQVPRWDGLVLDYEGMADIAPTGGVSAPVVRLRTGATRAAAQAEIASLVSGLPLPAARPGRPPARRPTIQVDPVRDALLSIYRSYLWLVVAAAGTVLAVAAANLSTLLLVRGRARAQVGAVCAALGASRTRLARVALLESGIVCTGGALVTLVTLAFVGRSLRAVLPPIFARYSSSIDDTRVLGFSLLVACVSAVLAGLWPAWRASRVDLRTLLQATSRSGRFRTVGGRSLLAIEAALGTALVLGGALCVRSFVGMTREDLGFVPTDLYALTVGPVARPESPQAALAWYDTAIEALGALPGVRFVGGADVVVGSGAAPMRGLSSAYPGQGGRYQITARYFETIGTRLIAGRSITEAEIQAGANVAMLSDSAARLVWPDEPPSSVVGRTLLLPDDPPRIVVGVVPSFGSLSDTPRRPALYLPKGAQPSSFTDAVVRMEPGRALDIRTVRAALASRAGEARVDVRYLPATLEPFLVDPRFRAVLLGTLALTGLILAAIGLYAAASADVTYRRYETGVRLALGASERDVARRVILDTCRPVLVGVLLGLMFSYWSAQFFQAFLRRVDGRDPWTYALVALTLVLTAVAAAWLPARRAASTDPATVLRAQ
jgi:putative ABC transport system permease protein